MSPFRGLSGASKRFVCDFFCTSAAMYVVGLSVPVCMCVSTCLMIPSFFGAGPVQEDQRERKSEERRSKSKEKEREKESKRKKREEARRSKNCVSRRYGHYIFEEERAGTESPQKYSSKHHSSADVYAFNAWGGTIKRKRKKRKAT